MAAEEIANTWMVEYVCEIVWKQFQSTKKVDIVNTRDLIQGVVSLPSLRSTQLTSKINFLTLMCRLADGSDYTTLYQNEQENEKTVLETVIPLFDRFMSLFLKSDDSLTKQCSYHRSLIKAQSVLTCYKAADFAKAEDVFERQYKEPSILTDYDKAWAAKLRTMLRSRNKNNKLVIENSFDKFLDEMVEFFEPLTKTWNKPLLLKICEVYSKHRMSLNKNEKRVIKPSELLKMNNGKIRDTDITDLPVITHQREQKINEMLEESETVTGDQSNNNIGQPSKQNGESFHEEVSSTSRKSPEQKSPSKRSIGKPKENNININPTSSPEKTNSLNKFVYRKNKNRANRHEPIQSSSDNESYDPEPIPSKIPKKTFEFLPSRESLAPPPDGQYSDKAKESFNMSFVTASSGRKKWTKEEDEDLFHAVKKHGVGRWANIKLDIRNAKTGPQCKDRWRNLIKSNLILQLVEKFGDYEN
ncbi:hypothetical protein LOTGIDRAFT_164310 [Lottia gigantea]|uniref:Uncharacterized protein n=1 Tax=Lottia gigantea TaxID=225164 RepID=V4BNG0_LOTGI|nr:hypothetical protein LOTGIDRAFT_164310 [Lottia gigantea]ESO90384.1 hypothetical protein LOTGIDRAFT_164310 [Lottia gigantea]